MRQPFEFRSIFGILIWIGILAGGIILVRNSFSRAPDATRQLADYIGQQRHVVAIEFPDYQLLRVGDPVFGDLSNRVSPIGFVSRIESTIAKPTDLAWVEKAEVTLFGSAPQLNEGDFLEYHDSPESTAWVLQTMLPPEKRDQIRRLIMDAYQKNQSDLVNSLRPLVEASLKDAASVIREDMQAAFESRETELRAIGRRFQSDLVEKEIVPLVQDEIWPIVEEEVQPLAGRVGQEIWNEVSVFRFGWRYLYDRTPLPGQNLTEKEFKRFVDQKAMPIMESHVSDFVELQKVLIQRISANERVQETMSESFKTIVKDPEVQDLLSDVFREVFVNNERLQGVLEERWNSPEAKNALALANQRLEPTITEIGMALFGSPREAITPEFAMVLRRRILHKDSRWLTLEQSASNDSHSNNSASPLQAPTTLRVRNASAQETIPYAPSRTQPDHED